MAKIGKGVPRKDAVGGGLALPSGVTERWRSALRATSSGAREF
jgi:hypothetical protein